MIERLPQSSGQALGLRASGTLRHEDFQSELLPLVAATAARGPFGILVQFADDFAGWDLHGLWDEIGYHTRYARTLKRMALVGDAKWQSWAATLAKPVPLLEIRHFHGAELDAAWRWLRDAG